MPGREQVLGDGVRGTVGWDGHILEEAIIRCGDDQIGGVLWVWPRERVELAQSTSAALSVIAIISRPKGWHAHINMTEHAEQEQNDQHSSADHEQDPGAALYLGVIGHCGHEAEDDASDERKSEHL
jgi:hypothetical protein